MIAYLYDNQSELIDWAEAHVTPGFHFRNDVQAIGVAIDGKIRAVAAFDTFSPGDCLVTIASDGSRHWFTREFAVRVMVYPFVQCKLNRISCLISSANHASLAFTHKFGGWELEGILREAGVEGEDLYLFGMLKRDCKWLTMPKPAMAV